VLLRNQAFIQELLLVGLNTESWKQTSQTRRRRRRTTLRCRRQTRTTRCLTPTGPPCCTQLQMVSVINWSA